MFAYAHNFAKVRIFGKRNKFFMINEKKTPKSLSVCKKAVPLHSLLKTKQAFIVVADFLKH